MLTKPERDLIRYQDKVNQHVCVHCKNPLPEEYNFVLCRGCLDKRNSNARELRAYRKIHGLCTVCGKRKALPGRLNCEYCRDTKNAYQRKQYQKKCLERITQIRTLNSSEGTT